MKEPGESEALESGGEVGGLPLQSSRVRQGTESREAEARRNDCLLPASRNGASSLLQGALGAETQAAGKGKKVSPSSLTGGGSKNVNPPCSSGADQRGTGATDPILRTG